MKLLFQNARILDVNSPYHLETVDVLVEEQRILAIGVGLSDEVDSTIDLQGAYLTTGFAELHSDLGEPGNEESEDLQSGAAAAAASGFTAVGVVSNGAPWIENKTGMEFLLSKSEDLPVHLAPIGTVSKGHQGEEMSELFEMSQYGGRLFGDYKRGLSNGNLLKLALLYTKPFGRIMVHPEDQNLTANGKMNEGVTSTYAGLKGMPEVAETVQIQRDLHLLAYTEGAMHIASVSTAKGLEAIRTAKASGLNVTCSVNAHHLLFDDSVLEGYNSDYKVNPPLRTREDVQALWAGLADGTVDCLAIDHLPKDIEQKQCEFDHAAFGMAGFEGALCHFLDQYEGSLERLQEVLSTTPRALLGLPELKIVEGEEAEFTIFAKNGQHWTGFASKAFNNPFKGEHTAHNIVGTYCKGTYYAL